MRYLITVLATAILLVTMVLLVSAKPRLSKLVTIWALIIAAGGGLLIYGYGYMDVTDNLPLAILSALLAVCGSFVGADEYSVIPPSEALQTPLMQILCTFIRICALYVTASTVISAIGAGALQRLRLWMSRRGTLHLIYGTAEDAPSFARQLLDSLHGSVVFVVDEPDEDYASAIANAGCVLRTDSHSLRADKAFLRSIGLGRRNRPVTLYALDRDSSANISYARQLLDSLHQEGCQAQYLHLVILAQEETAIRHLQQDADTDGYGSVTAISEPQMAARLLMRKHPPCNSIAFDTDGRATEDFEALVIGFGQVGQEVLKSLIMHGQFAGSHFRAHIFSPDCHEADGNFAHRLDQLQTQYHLEFHRADGRSRELYDHLASRGNMLRYAVVCTGSQKLNREIARQLCVYFAEAGLDVPLFTCSHSGVESLDADGICTKHNIYCTDVLSTGQLDTMAAVLNHRYQSASGKTLEDTWKECDYFSRQSCRASADFISAMLCAVGKTAEQAMEDWDLTPAQLENLSQTEHLRWCAFHYCMGFRPMTDEEFHSRAQTYLQQTQAGIPPLRIGKNMIGRTHACLVSWEELPLLSQKEAAVTGMYTDYQQMDTDNVLAIPQLLRHQ